MPGVPLRRLPIFFALVAIACTTGCGTRSDTWLAGYTPGPQGYPRSGGTIVLVREEDPDYLDPALSYGVYSAPVTLAVFRTMVEYEDAAGPAGAVLHAEIAESMPDLREERTLYCFKIRPDARFGAPVHRPITADDFKFAIERLFAVGSPAIPFYSGIVGADRVLRGEDSTLAGVIARGDSLYVRLVKPDPVFLEVFSMPFSSPLPREHLAKHPNDFARHTVSTGPYAIAEFIPRQRMVLVKNPDYWGRPAWADTIVIRFGVSSINACALVRRGLVDGGFFEVPPAEFARMVVDSTWKRQVDVADGLNTEYLFMNVREKPFDDVRVRQAVCWAVDRDAIVKVYAGAAVPAGEFLPHAMPGAAPLGRYLPRDVARARQLLREAGYPNGLRTRLYGWTVQPGPRELELIQGQLAEAGIEVELDLGETSGYTAMAEDTTNHIPFGLAAWTADYVDPSNFFDVLLNGARITPTQNLNLSLFDDPQVNAWIAEAAGTTDPQRRAAIWQQVDRRVMDLAPVAPLIHQYESRLWSPRVGGWYRHITRILKLESLYLKGRASPVAGSS